MYIIAFCIIAWFFPLVYFGYCGTKYRVALQLDITFPPSSPVFFSLRWPLDRPLRLLRWGLASVLSCGGEDFSCGEDEEAMIEKVRRVSYRKGTGGGGFGG